MKHSSKQQRQLIQIRRRKAGMDDQNHRDFMQIQFGMSSTIDLTYQQAEQYLEHLADLGYGSESRNNYRPKPGQDGYIRILWQQLADAGVLDRPDEFGMNAFIKRTTGIDDLAWCDTRAKSKVITALKRWVKSLEK